MPKKTTSRKSDAGFEKSLAELEKLVERMEDGDQKLEDALKDFERGIELTRHCQQALQEAELKVSKLLEENGEERLAPLDDED
ncbi:MAG: exodeoxyribonuclease VII small subunit [Gammaproteobacteria bacterium]|nr:exodeoxyribonuclease VII small subunit [Gammaproteobacteria bacterium]